MSSSCCVQWSHHVYCQLSPRGMDHGDGLQGLVVFSVCLFVHLLASKERIKLKQTNSDVEGRGRELSVLRRKTQKARSTT